MSGLASRPIDNSDVTGNRTQNEQEADGTAIFDNADNCVTVANGDQANLLHLGALFH